MTVYFICFGVFTVFTSTQTTSQILDAYIYITLLHKGGIASYYKLTISSAIVRKEGFPFVMMDLKFVVLCSHKNVFLILSKIKKFY